MRKLFLLVALFSTTFFAYSREPEDSTEMLMAALAQIDSIEAKLHYKTGTVTLENGMATINIAPGFKFLDAKDARYVLEEVWGNLKGQTALGMILPADSKVAIADYAFIVEYDAIGYVKDEDADEINYEDLLQEMKDETIKSNEERRKAGVSEMNLIGWAAKPFYNKERKLLYWAKEFKVDDSDENTLNYDIRVLGRKGVLILQAVSGITQLDSVNKNIDNILGMVSFNNGHRYQDFDSNVDDVAAWTIGGLVAGKMLAKAGILALILKNIKLVILAFAGIGGAAWRFFTGKKKKALDAVTTAPEPVEEAQS
ncbi:MAG TPA: DUF2167 domain-containing protein [Flavisolibacter sp.]|jgi:uncharacterized membrane-anchored protein|nr:DUF2167 domain-containing protein [Flavisolibacter sp.]